MAKLIRNRGHHTLMFATIFGILAGTLLLCQAALAEGGDAECDGQATATKFEDGQPVAWLNGSFHCTLSTCNNGAEQCDVMQIEGEDGQTSSKGDDCSMTVTTNMTCRCPSGNGDKGCHEVWSISIKHSKFGIPGKPKSKMTCAGKCPDGQGCGFGVRDTHGNRDCRCQ